jgi:TRAP-type C4-dicarboxylate transport system substrate-binding protein
LASVFAGPCSARATPPEFEIKLATLAPENSSLMKIFKEMNAEVLRRTDGRVGFKIFAGFVLGDEYDVLRKLRIGLIHAATFTHTALTNLNPDLRVLQIPFLFKNYREVDYILQRMDADFKRGFSEKGYEVLGWSELGFLYIMSTFPVSGVGDLKGKKVWSTPSSPMANELFAEAGVSPVTINPPDVLVALQTKLLDVVYNSPYYALITQWHSRTDYITDLPLAYIGGSLMIDKKALLRLPPGLQETLRATCTEYLRRLIEKTRKDNEQALDVITGRGMELVTPKPAEVQRFKRLVDQAMSELDPELLPRDVLRKLEAELEAYRNRHEEQP